MGARSAAAAAALILRLAIMPAKPKKPAGPTRAHDGSADRIREGVAVLNEKQRFARLAELADAIQDTSHLNRQQRRERERRLRRAVSRRRALPKQ